jgi:hypothetical protein
MARSLSRMRTIMRFLLSVNDKLVKNKKILNQKFITKGHPDENLFKNKSMNIYTISKLMKRVIKVGSREWKF